jgi:hypothetical protein
MRGKWSEDIRLSKNEEAILTALPTADFFYKNINNLNLLFRQSKIGKSNG